MVKLWYDGPWLFQDFVHGPLGPAFAPVWHLTLNLSRGIGEPTQIEGQRSVAKNENTNPRIIYSV